MMTIKNVVFGCNFFLKEYMSLLRAEFGVVMNKEKEKFYVSDEIWLCHPLKKQIAVEIPFAVKNDGEEVFTFAEQQQLLEKQKEIKLYVSLFALDEQKLFKKEYNLKINEEKSYVVLIDKKTYPEFVLVYDIDEKLQEEWERWCRQTLGDNPKLTDNLFEGVHGI